ncbi:extracellular solute-binding protein [Promicromonospora xylanilytica]
MNTARLPRRPVWRLVAGAVSLAVLVGATGCSGGGEDDGTATIRFSWWGSEERTARMQEAIDLFEAENPDIHVEGDFVDWDGYWDKLATSVAGGNTPDVLMQEDRYLGDYANRGVVADLGAQDIATDDIDPTLLGSGEIDGTQYGVPTGSNVYTVIANPAMFEAAGVEMPDDTTWTWDDYEEIANAISDGSPDGVHGTSDYSYNETAFTVYARQHGQSLLDENGELGYDDELLVEWFERSLRLQEEGGQPPADEALNLDLLDSPIAKNVAAMTITWSAQLGPVSTAAGQDMVPLRMPGEAEHERPGMFFKPGMYMAQAADSEHPEAAARFIDFFVNSPEVGEIFLTELGLPGSAPVRETVSENLPESEQVAADYVVDLADEIVDAPAPLPNGAGDLADIMNRINSDVLFERQTPEEAAAQFRSEAEAAIG